MEDVRSLQHSSNEFSGFLGAVEFGNLLQGIFFTGEVSGILKISGEQ